MKREGSWMPLFGDAFFESEKVVAMSPAAGLLYLFLIWHEYKNGPFSAEKRFLRRLCSRFEEFDDLWPEVEPCFQKSADGRLSNHRCEVERSFDLEVSRKRSKAAFSRWEKIAASKSNASAVILQCPTEPTEPTRPTSSPSVNKARPAPPLDTAEVLREFPKLDHPEVLASIDGYIAGRRERRQKAQTARGIRMALKGLSDLDADGARGVIDQATAGGWLGWPPDAAAKNGTNGVRPFQFETAFDANMRDLAKLADTKPGAPPWQTETKSLPSSRA